MYAIISPHRRICSFSIQVTPSINAVEFGAPTATRQAKTSVKLPQVSPADRLFWLFFSKYVEGWRLMLHALHPDTVVRWHRQGFRFYWRWKSRRHKPGRPPIDTELRRLIRQMQSGRGRHWMADYVNGTIEQPQGSGFGCSVPFQIEFHRTLGRLEPVVCQL